MLHAGILLNKNKLVIAGIVIAIAMIAIIALVIQKPHNETKSQWIVSGPFAINKPQYKLGENVFITVNGLNSDEVGDILFVRPDGTIYSTLSFNGTLKDHFNYYFKPDTRESLKTFKVEQLVGKWQVIFYGVKYPPLDFEIINEFVPGEERYVIDIPTNSTSLDK